MPACAKSSTRSPGAKRAASLVQLKSSDRGSTTSDGRCGARRVEPPGFEHRQHHHRLAQTHVVGEAAAEAEVAEEPHPAERLALVVAQLAVERRRRVFCAATPSKRCSASRARAKPSSQSTSGCAASSASMQRHLRRLEADAASPASPSASTGATRASHSSGSMPIVPSPSVTVRRPALSAFSRSGRSTLAPRRPKRRSRTSRCPS